MAGRTKRPAGYDTAARNIVERIRATVDMSTDSLDDLTTKIQNSDLYGEISPSTLRALLTRAGRYANAPTLYQPLCKAIAFALRVDLDTLATDAELACLPTDPHRQAQRADTRAPVDTGDTVPEPFATAERLHAYRQKYGMSTRSFVTALRRHGYETTESEYRRTLRDQQHLITRQLIFAASEIFTAQDHQPFDRNRLLYCDNNRYVCPHCHPWSIRA